MRVARRIIKYASFNHAKKPGLYFASSDRNLKDKPSVTACTFVLLQYNHPEVTCGCVEHIRKLVSTIPISVIVVDNGSSEVALSETRAFCAGDPAITLIETGKNLGFARGNNEGYRLAKSKSTNQIVVVMNNDVMIEDRNFIKKILIAYDRDGYSVLAPDIIVPGKNKMHQNPFRYELRSRDNTVSFIENCARKIDLIEKGQMTLSPHQPRGKKHRDFRRRTGEIVPHGSAYIVSPIFLMDFENIFDERTFLYGEEDILALRALSRGHRIVYDPSVRVWHHTKASTDTKNLENYYLFRYRSSIESARIYVSLWDEIINKVEKK